MEKWTRRELLKTGLAASAGAATAGVTQPLADAVHSLAPGNRSSDNPTTAESHRLESQGSYRERLLLDFGWRFHLGHASDPSRDFGFGAIERS